MPRPKIHTDLIFADLEKTEWKGSYGYLSQMFRVFALIASIRNEKRMTQQELAKKSGVPRPTIARIEAGRANPTLYQLVRIASALNLKISFVDMTKEEIEELKDADLEGYRE